jgi:hypothetical protein
LRRPNLERPLLLRTLLLRKDRCRNRRDWQHPDERDQGHEGNQTSK